MAKNVIHCAVQINNLQCVTNDTVRICTNGEPAALASGVVITMYEDQL
jgi:hypothetical protein